MAAKAGLGCAGWRRHGWGHGRVEERRTRLGGARARLARHVTASRPTGSAPVRVSSEPRRARSRVTAMQRTAQRSAHSCRASAASWYPCCAVYAEAGHALQPELRPLMAAGTGSTAARPHSCPAWARLSSRSHLLPGLDGERLLVDGPAVLADLNLRLKSTAYMMRGCTVTVGQALPETQRATPASTPVVFPSRRITDSRPLAAQATSVRIQACVLATCRLCLMCVPGAES